MWNLPRLGRGPEAVRRHRAASRGLQPALDNLEERMLLSSADPFQPTAYEQYMLAQINAARANPAAFGQALLAEVQASPTLQQSTAGENLAQFAQVISSYAPEPPLAFNTRLIEAARDHDQAMLAANEQFHSASNYLQAYYPTGSGGWATGENIFAYSGNVNSTDTKAFADYFTAAFFLDWGNPDFGHLKNLLAPGPGEANTGAGQYPFSEIGVGLLTNVTPTTAPGANNPVAANQGLNVGPDLVTEEFGWRQNVAFLTGTAFQDAAGTGSYLPGEGRGSVTITAVGTGGQGTFQTQTWDSGGYSLQLPPGTYTVTATGNLPAPASTTVTIGVDNVPWDVKVPQGAAGQPVSTPPVTTPTPTPTPVVVTPTPTPTFTPTPTITTPTIPVTVPTTGLGTGAAVSPVTIARVTLLTGHRLAPATRMVSLVPRRFPVRTPVHLPGVHVNVAHMAQIQRALTIRSRAMRLPHR